MKYRDLLDACDVVFEVGLSNSDSNTEWYKLGYLANAAPNEQRPVVERGEIGSNSTILLLDEGQRGISFQRLNVARGADSAAHLETPPPYERNFPAMIKWIVSNKTSTERIIVELDDPHFNTPFDIRKTYYAVDRETGDASSAQAIAKIVYRNCRIAQLGIGVGASSKYMEDGVSIAWEETDVEDIGTGLSKEGESGAGSVE